MGEVGLLLTLQLLSAQHRHAGRGHHLGICACGAKLSTMSWKVLWLVAAKRRTCSLLVEWISRPSQASNCGSACRSWRSAPTAASGRRGRAEEPAFGSDGGDVVPWRSPRFRSGDAVVGSLVCSATTRAATTSRNSASSVVKAPSSPQDVVRRASPCRPLGRASRPGSPAITRRYRWPDCSARPIRMHSRSTHGRAPPARPTDASHRRLPHRHELPCRGRLPSVVQPSPVALGPGLPLTGQLRRGAYADRDNGKIVTPASPQPTEPGNPNPT